MPTTTRYSGLIERNSLRAYGGVKSGLRLLCGSATLLSFCRTELSISAVRRTIHTGLPRHSTRLISPGASWLTSFDCCGLVGKDSIALTGTNARAIALGTDGLLYIVLAGTPTAADGKLSIVDPTTRREVAVLNGLGESPGPAVYHPSGRLLVASATEGILEVNTLTRTVTRGPGNGIKPSGDGIAALALDPRGRVYAVAPGACASPGTVHILSGPPDYRALGTVTVGVCPAAAALTAQPPIP